MGDQYPLVVHHQIFTVWLLPIFQGIRPLLMAEEKERQMGWHLGVNF